MRFVRDIIAPLLAGLAFFALFQITVGSFKVYGSCMLPNVQPGEYIIVSKIAYFFHPPKRGEVIVFHSPQNPNADLVKRIIALPGDTIEIKDGFVFVNNTPLVENYTFEAPHYSFPLEEIPADHYFVLGDNRNNSADSHKGWTVPCENIVGKAWLTYWPPQKWRLIEHYKIDTGKQEAKFGKLSLTMKMLCPTK